MTTFFSGVGVVLALELRQRVRGVAWYVLIGIFVALVAVVTFAVWFITVGFDSVDDASGAGIFSTIIYFVLLLGTLVAPALSGNAINGDREAGTLATTQVTLITTWQLVIGKFLAAWITALGFLVASLPFLIFGQAIGGVGIGTIVVSTLVLALELGVVAAIGVGLSGIFAKPLFSVVVTYLVVAGLSVGTLITFALAGAATQSTVVSTTSYGVTYSDTTGQALTCDDPETDEYTIPRFDYYWGILAANPYVVLADAAPTRFVDGYPNDLFGTIKVGVRSAQLTPNLNSVYDECDPSRSNSDGGYFAAGSDFETSEEIVEATVPSWFVGLAVHVLMGAGALAGAWARTNTPARTLSAGSRIA
jgi:ABC-2 type transport system permease protein